MKKVVTIILLFGLVAQLNSQSHFEGGISIGAVSTQVDGDSYSGYNKSGIKAGFWVAKPLNPKVYLSFEMNYFPKGSKSSIVLTPEDTDFYLLVLHYIEMPVSMLYNYDKYFFEVGVAVNYLFSDKQEGIYLQNQHYSNKTGFNMFDYTSFAGIGKILNERWRISARICYSMWDAAKEYVPPSERLYKRQYNNTLSVSLFWRLTFL